MVSNPVPRHISMVKLSLGMRSIQFVNFMGVDCCKKTPSVKSAKHSYSCYKSHRV